METINALDIHSESDYSTNGIMLFVLSNSKGHLKGETTTFTISPDDVLKFSLSASSFSLDVRYFYNITDFMNKISRTENLAFSLHRHNLSYKRFNISATLIYNSASFNSEFVELFFAVKDLNYEEL